MKIILTKKGQEIIVDEDDFEYLNQFKWFINWAGYALTTSQPSIRMHRMIMKVKDPKIQIDHISLNKCDNRKENLRKCNNSKNMMNRTKYKCNKSGFKGVFKHRKKWQAKIRVNKRQICLGCFITPEEAALAYNNAAIKYHKDFARINSL